MDRCDLTGRECPAGGGCINLGSTADPSYMCFTPCTAGTEPGDSGFACRDAGEIGVPDDGEYSCYPIATDSWLDTTDADGFCYLKGNWPGGDGVLGSACTEDTDCLSPKGLGTCIAPWDYPPLFCSSWCNENLGNAGFCGGADGTTGIATGACFAGLCFQSCDTPNGTLGANGCSQNMACYDKATFDPYVYVDSTATAPAGVCFAPCTADMCAEFFTVPTTCNTVTGVCEL